MLALLAFQTTVNQTFLDDDSYPRIFWQTIIQPPSGFAFINTMYELYVAERSLALSPCRWPTPPESAEWMDVFFWCPKNTPSLRVRTAPKLEDAEVYIIYIYHKGSWWMQFLLSLKCSIHDIKSIFFNNKCWVVPLPSNHQDYYVFSRGSL